MSRRTKETVPMFPSEENLKSLALIHLLASIGQPLWPDRKGAPEVGKGRAGRFLWMKRASKWVLLTLAEALIAVGNWIKAACDVGRREVGEGDCFGGDASH